MAVATKSNRSVATAKKTSRKSPAKTAKKATVSEMSEARKRARSRQPESRSRAVQELGIDPKAGEVQIYSLKNRLTGQTRVLIDARGSRFDGSPWIVRDPETGAEAVFETRKALGANYAKCDLKPVAQKRSVKRPARKARGTK